MYLIIDSDTRIFIGAPIRQDIQVQVDFRVQRPSDCSEYHELLETLDRSETNIFTDKLQYVVQTTESLESLRHTDSTSRSTVVNLAILERAKGD